MMFKKKNDVKIFTQKQCKNAKKDVEYLPKNDGKNGKKIM